MHLNGGATRTTISDSGGNYRFENVQSENAERLVLTAFANFLARESPTELSWISRAFRAMPDILSKVKSATKKDFMSRVAEAYENQANESLRTEVEEIARLAKAKLPAAKEKSEDDEKEKKEEEKTK